MPQTSQPHACMAARAHVLPVLVEHLLQAATFSGVAVILTHHSKCERGFLPVAASRLVR